MRPFGVNVNPTGLARVATGTTRTFGGAALAAGDPADATIPLISTAPIRTVPVRLARMCSPPLMTAGGPTPCGSMRS